MAKKPKRAPSATRRRARPPEAPITPLFIPKITKTIVLYGGSFDPMTLHHWVASHCVNNLALQGQLFVYVPAAKSPLKAHGPVASDVHRIAMMRVGDRLEMNAEEHHGHRARVLWTDEIDRARWERARGIERASYTIDTVERLRRILPRPINIRLLIGSDQAVNFHHWKDSEKLLELAEPMVMLRPPLRSVRLFVEAMRRLGYGVREQLAWATRVVPGDVRDDSSTSVRDELPKMPLQLETWPDSLLKYRISDDVKRYIIKHKLYGVGTKFMPQRERRR